jgi:hypothetical protein
MSKALSLFRALSRRHPTPRHVQRLLRRLPYNREEGGETVRSALAAWRRGHAHCLEAALLAAAILEHRGFPPLVMSLESQDDLDHVIFVFRARTGWGAVARSRDEGLHGRPPRFPTLRALARSYAEPFVDKTGRLEGFGLANLDDSGARWRDSPRNLWSVERFLIELKHQPYRTSDRDYARWHRRYLSAGALPRRAHWW